MKHIVTLSAVLMLGACAATPEQIARDTAQQVKTEAELADALKGYAAGTPVSCINPRNDNTTIFGDKIMYRGGSSRVYVTNTNGGCFGLRRNDIIVTRSTNGQLCSGDIVTTVDPTSRMQSGSCAFGEFVPYKRVRR